MSLNHLEIDKILIELNLTNFLIQKVRQISYHKIIFHLYRATEKHIFVILCNQEKIGIYFSSKTGEEKKVKTQRFEQCLRANIEGSKIIDANQIDKNRVIKLELKKGNELFNFYIKLWSNSSNVLLCDSENRIVDTLFRRPKKNEISGAIFQIPEKNNFMKDFKIRDFSNKTFLYNAIEEICETEDYSSIENFKEKILTQIYGEKSILEHKIETLKNKKLETKNIENIKTEADSLLINYTEKDNIKKANQLYERYKKEKKNREIIENNIIYLEQNLIKLNKNIENIYNYNDFKDLKNFNKMIPTKPSESEIGLTFYSQDFKILVGRNSKENDALLRTRVKSEDLWLHIRDYSGGYIFIKYQKNKSIPLDVLIDAGNLAIWFSKGKNCETADIYYTKVKFLKRVKNGKQGLVIPANEKNLFIKKDEGRLNRILKIKNSIDF